MLNFGGGNNIILVAMDTPLRGAMDILGGEASHALRQPAALLRFRPLEDWPTHLALVAGGGGVVGSVGGQCSKDGKDMVGFYFWMVDKDVKLKDWWEWKKHVPNIRTMCLGDGWLGNFRDF